MSNRVDFFQSDNDALTIPAAHLTVFIDGQLCTWLHALEIVRAGWPEFSYARLAFNPAADASCDTSKIENIQAKVSTGQSVELYQVYNGTSPGVSTHKVPIFTGHIEALESSLGEKGESVVIMARDFSAHLRRITVQGKRVQTTCGDTMFIEGSDVIFNNNASPNASQNLISRHGRSYRAFSADLTEVSFFTWAQVINYLLCEYLPADALEFACLEQLETLAEQQTIYDLDLTGMNLLEALYHCCDLLGLAFHFEPTLTETGPRQAIVFYLPGKGRSVELNLQPTGEKINLTRTNIATMTSQQNFWPVIRRYIGQGDYKIFEVTFNLIKAWDPNLESDVYDDFSISGNDKFYQVRDVYRRWCLNEAGDYTSSPFNQGQAFDFSPIFESDFHLKKRRRFLPALTTDNQRRSLGHFLEISFDSGDNWRQYWDTFDVFNDECGIWLSCDQLHINTWVAAQQGTLRFRITAAVASDERLSCDFADGPVGSAAPVEERIIKLPRRYSYRKVSNQSIFYNSTDPAIGAAAEVDDSAQLRQLVRKRAGKSEVIGTVDLQTPYPALHYLPGDIVTSSPDSRPILPGARDNRSICCIEKMRIDLIKQYTELKITRRRTALL